MHTLLIILLPFLLSVILSALIIPRILVVTYRKKLFDYPDARKVHTTAIPRLGGFSFLPGILFSLFFSVGVRYLFGVKIAVQALDFIVPEFHFFFCGLILLYLAGLKDDLIGLRYRSKFAIQIIAVSMLPLSGLWLNNLYGLFGIYELAPYIGIPFTLLVMVFIINAINLIDGLDGLASGLSAIPLIILGALFYSGNLWIYAILAFATLGTLIPFFLYNVFGKAERCKKIFMGDTGSLTLGYLLAFLVIRYSVCQPELMPCSGKAFMLAFSTLLVPIFDVFRVMGVRARQHKSLFLADRNHIHHKLLESGLTPASAMLTILILGVLFCLLNIFLNNYININLMLFINILIYTGVNIYINQLIKKRQSQISAYHSEKQTR